LIEQAIKMNLDGVCFTEHHSIRIGTTGVASSYVIIHFSYLSTVLM
jgi:hypothetical protein